MKMYDLGFDLVGRDDEGFFLEAAVSVFVLPCGRYVYSAIARSEIDGVDEIERRFRQDQAALHSIGIELAAFSLLDIIAVVTAPAASPTYNA